MSELVCRTLELLAENEGSFVSAVKNIFNTITMATLKISDLSVGDWVQVLLRKCDYDEPDTFKAKVLTVVNNSVGVGYDNSGIVMSAFVEDLQPIPITAEILEKNGFEEDNNGHYALKIGGIVAVDIEYTGGIWELSILDVYALQYAGKMQVTIAFVSSIHSLQHALRLTGVEKVINL